MYNVQLFLIRRGNLFDHDRCLNDTLKGSAELKQYHRLHGHKETFFGNRTLYNQKEQRLKAVYTKLFRVSCMAHGII